MPRIPGQRQQIADQIERKNRNLGKVATRDTRFYSFGGEDVVRNPDNQDQRVFRWRKRYFIKEYISQHYSPDSSDFIRYVIDDGGVFSTSFIDSTTGFLFDQNIPQFTSAAYSIEVWRKTPTSIQVPIHCPKSIRVEVDGAVVHDSGDLIPNQKTNITINIPGQRWCRITIYYYSSDANTDNNFLEFKPDLASNVEKSRAAIPVTPSSFAASQGLFPNEIKLTWTTLDDTHYQFFRIWYGSTSVTVTTLLAANVPGDLKEYTHAGIANSTHYFYQLEAITIDGDLSEKTSVVEGFTSAGDILNELTINLFPNITWNDENSTGYYQNETISFRIDSNIALSSSPYVHISGWNITDITPPYTPLVFRPGLIASSESKYFTFSFVPTGFHHSRLDILASSEFVSQTGYLIYDTGGPRNWGFTIETDATVNNNNAYYTRNQNIFLVHSGGVVDTGSHIDFTKADLYKVAFRNTIAGTLTYFDFQRGYPVNWSLTEGTGLKTVYGFILDKAGNFSEVATDTIYFSTGTIESIGQPVIVTGFDKLTINWPTLTRPDMAGYKLWRTVTSGSPSATTTPIADTASPVISSYEDFWSNIGGQLQQNTSYWYWIKGYNIVGDESANYSPSASGMLANTRPPDDIRITGVREGTTLKLTWQIATGSTTDQEAYYHNIYRKDISTYPTPNVFDSNTFFVQKIQAAGHGTQFFIFDTPPSGTNFYQYFSQAENRFGYLSTGYAPNPLGTGLKLSAGKPSPPIWISGESYNWYGYNHLVGSGLAYTQDSMQGYKIYRSTGTSFTDSDIRIIGNILNSNQLGAKFEFDDLDVNYFTPYYYWCTAFNRFNEESDPSTILTLSGVVEPNYGEFFANYLDNSSFERPFVSDTNWTLASPGQVVTADAIYGRNYVTGLSNNSKLIYSGYIYVQPTKQYYLSMYYRRKELGSINCDVDWYTPDRDTNVGTTSITFKYNNTTHNSWPSGEWVRVTGGNFTAPTNATNAKLTIWYASTSTGTSHVDAVQWEEYSSTLSPRPYVDSRVLSADRIQAHFIKGDMLEFNSIKGNKIVAETISGREIAAQSITTDKLVIGRNHNLVPNGSFEMNGFDMYDVTIVNNTCHVAANWSFNEWHATQDVGTSETAGYFGVDQSPNLTFPDDIPFGNHVLKIFPYTDNPDPRKSIYYAQSNTFIPMISGENFSLTSEIYHEGGGTTDEIPVEVLFLGIKFYDSELNALDYHATNMADTFVNITGSTAISGYGNGWVFYNPNDVATRLPIDNDTTISQSEWQHKKTTFYINDNRAKFAKPIIGVYYAITGNTGPNQRLDSLEIYGSDLLIGGRYDYLGPNTISGIGFWNGSTFSNFGTGVTSSTKLIHSILSSGNDFYIGGTFDRVGGLMATGIAKWNGSTWSDLGGVFNTGSDDGDYIDSPFGHVYSMVSYSGYLWIGGSFTRAGTFTTTGLTRWNGSAFVPLPISITGGVATTKTVYSLGVYNNELYAGGTFTNIGGIQASKLAKYNAITDTWFAVTGDSLQSVNGPVLAMHTGNNLLYIAGQFSTANNISIIHDKITSWDGSQFIALGSGLRTDVGGNFHVRALETFNGNLYVGGDFSGARYPGGTIVSSGVIGWNWTTNSWFTPGNGSNLGQFNALQTVGSYLYLGGSFSKVNGQSITYLCKYDGATFSTLLTEGITSGNNYSDTRSDWYFDGVQCYVGTGDREFIGDELVRIEHGGITANAIDAVNIRALNISGGHIQSDTIDTRHLKADIIESRHIKVQSQNLLKNPQFERWSGKVTPAPDYWEKAIGGTDLYEETTNIRSGTKALLVSGIGALTTWEITNPNRTAGGNLDNYYKLITESNSSLNIPNYSLGLWLYKKTGSATISGLYASLDCYRDEDFLNMEEDYFFQGLNFDSTYDGKWTFVSGTILGSDLGSTSDYGKINIGQSAGVTLVTGLRFVLDGVRWVEGREAPSGFSSEGITIIDGGYIKTGRIDADLVQVGSNTAGVTIDSGGIKVGNLDTTGVSISNSEIVFYHDHELHRVKRIDYYPDCPINVSKSFNSNFINIPDILMVPKHMQTYDSSFVGDQYIKLELGANTKSAFTPLAYLLTDSTLPNVTTITNSNLYLSDPSVPILYGDSNIATVGGSITLNSNNYISYLNSGAQMVTGNTIYIKARLTVTALSNTMVTKQENASWMIQFIYGTNVESGVSMTATAVQNYSSTFFWTERNEYDLPIDIYKEITWGGLSTATRRAIQIRAIERSNTFGPHITASINFTTATYTHYLSGSNLLTNSTVDAIVIERN